MNARRQEELPLDGTSASDTAKTWARQTQRIAAADEGITCSVGHEDRAGLAIQLALLRPELGKFHAWFRDLPNLPPAVWWAAATLCGWRNGYRALDKRFRGKPSLQECLAYRALATALQEQGNAWGSLPNKRLSRPKGRNEQDSFSLDWDGMSICSKDWHARGLWYNANLADPDTARAARKLASELGWSCLNRLNPPDGEGGLFVEGRSLEAGNEPVSLAQPVNAEAVFWLNHEQFRRQLATEGGDVTHPPPAPNTQYTDASLDPATAPDPTTREGEVQRHPQVPVSIPKKYERPRGLEYVRDFITEEEENDLLDSIDQQEWSHDLKRRVQHYGWRCDYKQRRVDESMRLDDLPNWVKPYAERLVKNKLVPELPDQVIVNEYRGKQGISAHIDQDGFAEPVVTLSLGDTWDMVFRRKEPKERVVVPLERRSVAVLTGDARYRWTHEIPSRKSEPPRQQGGSRRERKRRISITFRKVLPAR